MSRLSFRPRPLDIHKKLPIVKSLNDFEDDDAPSSTRSLQGLRLLGEADTEVHHVSNKKVAADIPTPQFVVVDTYERDYSRSFCQPTTYLRARGARAEIGEFVEYDLDIEDEEWIQEFNEERNILSPEKFESLLFKLEVLDHKARERAGVINQTLGSPIHVHLQLDAVVEALKAQQLNHTVLESVYIYWREKRERWQKPILRRLQPPPPVNDTNPYNVFRPREKVHRLHTRRMQRRENNVQSFEKLRQVRRNLDQARTILEALIKREEKKREVMETEVTLQRIQLQYKHEMEVLEDSFVAPSYQPFSNFGLSEDEPMYSEDVINSQLVDSKPIMASSGNTKHTFRWQNVAASWIRKMDSSEPIMLFTKPLLPNKLAAAGIIPPLDTSKTTSSRRSYQPHGRIGRGGRIIFDRWNPLLHMPVN